MEIGSRAIISIWPDFERYRKAWQKEWGFKVSNDYDRIVTHKTYTKFLHDNQDYIISVTERAADHFVVKTDDTVFEFEIARPGSSGEFYLQSNIPLEEKLLSIYSSHRFMPINWRKHIVTLNFLETMVGRDKIAKITNQRFRENEVIYGQLRTPSLNKNKASFFNDKTVAIRVFEHDDIHKIMAHYESPLFERIKPDPDKVLCSKDLWHNLSWIDKVKCVLEEVYVIALERKLIPMMFLGKEPYTTKEAFLWALQRVSTNLCSGWFREFASKNALAIFALRNPDYLNVFLQGFADGKITKL